MEQPEHQRAERPTRWGKAAERQWPRFKVDFSVKLVTGTAIRTTVQGRAQDLSEGGVSLYASVEFQEGQQVQVEFTPPFCRRAVEALAIVRARDGYRYGLEFRKLTQHASEDLSRACRALALSAE